MRRAKIFYRRKEVDKKISELKKEQEKILQEWNEVAQSCNHEITITTWKMETPIGMILSDVRPRTYCLLCDEHLSPKRYLANEEVVKIKNAVNINLQDYPSICNNWGRKHYINNLEVLYQEVSRDFANLSEREIGEIMKKRIDVIEAFI